jgi:serine/threonine protein kinase
MCTPETSGSAASFQWSNFSVSRLVFHDWTKHDFRIGCPHRSEQSGLFYKFKAELYRVVGLMHSAGVLHCDLYFSNIMWREHKGRVEIKLIDFDCSHLLSEGDFVPRAREAIKEHFSHKCFRPAGEFRNAEFHEEYDLKFVSIVELALNEENAEHWEDLASGVKTRIDPAFRWLLAESLAGKARAATAAASAALGSAHW